MLGQKSHVRDWKKTDLMLEDWCKGEWEQFGYFYEPTSIRMRPISSVRDRRGETRGIVDEACVTQYQKSRVARKQDQVRRQRRKLCGAMWEFACRDMASPPSPSPIVDLGDE
jgi:hypothetical protein